MSAKSANAAVETAERKTNQKMVAKCERCRSIALPTARCWSCGGDVQIVDVDEEVQRLHAKMKASHVTKKKES